MAVLPVYDATEIQKAIDAAAITTGVAQIPAGIYVATAPVLLASNVKLIFDPAAILRRKFDTNDATLWQPDPKTKIVNVSVSGGRIDNAAEYPGPQVSIYGDNVTISDMQVLDFYSVVGGIGGNGINITGNDNKLSSLRVVTSCQTTGAGGIRMLGGNNFLCSDCYVSSGDDALQFVPAAPDDPGNPSQNVSISNSQFVNCVGISAAARACSVFLENRSTNPMTANITNCAFIGIRGRGGSVGAICSNKGAPTASSGVIANIQFIGVSLALPETAPGPIFQVYRSTNNENPGGPVEQIDFIGCSAFDGPSALGLAVQEATRVRWIGGSIQAGANATAAVAIYSCTDCELKDATVICSSACTSGLYVGPGGGSNTASNRIGISGVTISGIPAGMPGIYLQNTTGCMVTQSTFLAAQEADGTYGIELDDSRNFTLTQNNLLSVQTPYQLGRACSGYIDNFLGNATSATGTIKLSGGTAAVTFDTPFPANTYSVQLTGNTTGETYAFTTRSQTGFTINCSNQHSTAEVCWTALNTHFWTK